MRMFVSTVIRYGAVTAAVLGIMFCSGMSVPAQSSEPGYNAITDVKFDPVSPTILENGMWITLKFSYSTTYPGGVRIWARPMSAGSRSLRYAASGSRILTAREGKHIQSFTIERGDVTVDEVSIDIYTVDGKTLLYQTVIPVQYRYRPRSPGTKAELPQARVVRAPATLALSRPRPFTPSRVPGDGPGQNRRIVLAFYEQALVKLQPRAAFERYVAPDFVEHKPDVPNGTRESTITYLEDLIRQLPNPQWKVLRTLAEGDYVFLHASFMPTEGAPAYAIGDIFRLSKGRIVEHWDIVAPPVKSQLNPNPRF